MYQAGGCQEGSFEWPYYPGEAHQGQFYCFNCITALNVINFYRYLRVNYELLL